MAPFSVLRALTANSPNTDLAQVKYYMNEPQKYFRQPSDMEITPLFWGVKRPNKETNFLDYVLIIRQKWKFIFIIVLIGALFSVFLALSTPKIFRPSVQVSLPSIDAVFQINANGVNEYTRQELFQDYFNLIRSKTNLRAFLAENQYLQRLYPNKFSEETADTLFMGFARNFVVKIDEPSTTKAARLVQPTQITIFFEHTNEVLVTELANSYYRWTNEKLLKRMSDAQQVQRSTQVEKLEDSLRQLRKNAMIARQFEISRIEAANDVRLEELKQEIELLTSTFEANRSTQIILAQEAREIAKEMGIIEPTELKDLKGGKKNDVQTNINMIDNQKLPLYLMGTKYLDIYIDSLKKRRSDENYLIKVTKLRNEIQSVKNDKVLEDLKNRSMDDPYIAGLTEILKEIEGLKSASLDFSGVHVYTLDSQSFITNQSVKPNRPKVAIAGTLIAFIFATLYVLTTVSIENRNKMKEQAE